MGALRDKAKSEVRVIEEKREEARRARKQNYELNCAEKLPCVVEFLIQWSGEEITESMLNLVKPIAGVYGPPMWDITIDGFDLRISAIGESPEGIQIDIKQITKELHGVEIKCRYRSIGLPYELLAEPD